MGSIFKRAGSPIWHLKFRDGLTADGKPRYRMVSARTEDEAEAEAVLAEVEKQIAERDGAPLEQAELEPETGGPLTTAGYAKRWLARREAQDLDWTNDRSRLAHHVLPVIGPVPIGEVRTKHLVDLFTRIRTVPREGQTELPSQRTVYNIYSVVKAMFRDAVFDEEIEQSPCVLTKHQLGRKRDKDPKWREGALFTRDEAQTIISTPKIPPDRQMVYGLELLAGVRPGEASALRWSDYDTAMRPLGKLLVGLSYSTRKGRAKGTKTDAVKHVPVHPTLAGMLAHWKLHGWAAMMGRHPEPGDLIVPLPPEHAARRRTRTGDAYRGHDYSGRLWREEDLPALGWRHRQNYDMRSTFVTLALDDGANPDVIRDRVTHAKPQRDAFDGYNRGQQWEVTCRELAKLRIVRRELGGEVITLPIAANGGGSGETSGETTVKPPERKGGSDVSRGQYKRRSATEDSAGLHSTTESRGLALVASEAERSGTQSSPTPEVSADPVSATLDQALRGWERERDPRRLRRDLLRLLAELEDA